jgi:hypothetical protein
MRHLPLFAAIAVMVTVGACANGRTEDAGTSVSRSYPVAAFDKIEVAGPYEVAVTTGGQPSVQARGGEKLLAKTVVEIKNGTLVIRPEKRRNGMGWSWSERGEDKVRFSVTVPSLSGAAIAGSGDIAVDRVAGQRFIGEIAGSGGLTVRDLAVGELGLEIAGSGNIKAKGRATQARYEIAGSGNIEAGEVASERLQAEIAGTGNIDANARATAQVDVTGVGNVRITGGAKCAVSKTGPGNVNCS